MLLLVELGIPSIRTVQFPQNREFAPEEKGLVSGNSIRLTGGFSAGLTASWNSM
jgi:hypothetical protein